MVHGLCTLFTPLESAVLQKVNERALLCARARRRAVLTLGFCLRIR